MGAAGIGGGAELGVAKGAIALDLRQFQQGIDVAITAAQNLEQRLQKVGRTSATTSGSMGRDWGGVQTVVKNVSNGFAEAAVAITAFGITSSRHVNQTMRLFNVLSGSEKQATENLADLRDMANDTRQPFLEMVDGSLALLPAIKGTNAELEDTISLVQRLAILDPAQGAAGGALAIREFLSGEYLSLVRRFELDRTTLKNIRDEYEGDTKAMLDALNDYIEAKTGLTEEKMAELSRSGQTAFRVLRDEAILSAAQGFAPLTSTIQDVAFMLADWLQYTRDINPELQKMLSTFTAMAAIAGAAQFAGGLPVVGQRVPKGALIKAGVTGAALYAGVQGGVALGRAAGAGDLKGQSQQGGLDVIGERLKQVLFMIVAGLNEVAWQVREGAYKVGNMFRNSSDFLSGVLKVVGMHLQNAFADVVDAIGYVVAQFYYLASQLSQRREIDLGLTTIGIGNEDTSRELWIAADRAKNWGDSLRYTNEEIQAANTSLKQTYDLTEDQTRSLQEMRDGQETLLVSFAKWLGLIEDAPNVMEQAIGSINTIMRQLGSTASGLAGDAGLTFNDDQLNAWTAFQDDMQDITQQAIDKRLAAEQGLNEKLADLDTQDAERRADAAEERAYQYRRALASLNKDINRVWADLGDQEQSEQSRYQASVVEARAEYYAQQEEDEQDHLERRAQIMKDGQYDLLSAAARLDGIALWQARRKMSRDIEQEDDAYTKLKQQRAKDYQDRQAQEKKEHEDRLDNLREAAEERVESLKESFQEQQEAQDEALRRQYDLMDRAKQREISRLNQAYQDELLQINAWQTRMYGAREGKFAQEWNQLVEHENQKIALYKHSQTVIEANLRAWLANMQRQTAPAPSVGSVGSSLGSSFTTAAGRAMSNISGFLGSFATGGNVTRSGMYALGAGETVLNQSETRSLSSLLNDLVATGPRALAGGGGVSVSVGDIYQTFPDDLGGWTPDELSQYIRDDLAGILQEAVAVI